MKRFAKLIVLFIAIAFICSGCNEKDRSADIPIGIIASLNGPAGEQGKNWMRGAELAAQDAQAAGIPVKLVIEDDQTETKKVIAAFSKLVEVDHVKAIVGGTWDYLGEAAYPLAARYKIPFITPTNPVEVLSDSAKASGYVYSNSMTLASVKHMMERFFTSHHAHSLGIVYPSLPFGTEQAKLVKEIAKENNLTISYDFEFPVEGLVSDIMKVASLKLKEIRPDVTFAVLDYNYIDLLTKELKALSISPTILVTQHLDRALIFSNDPKRYKSMYAIYPRVQDTSFEEHFREKFGESPRVYAAHGYDAVLFLANALSQNIQIQDPSIHFEYLGITGKHILPAPTRRLVNTEAVIMTTKNGIFEKEADFFD